MKTDEARDERSAPLDLPGETRPPRRWRTLWRLIVLVAILWFFGGVVGAAVGAAISLYLLIFAPAPGGLHSRILLLASAVLLLAVPAVILFRGLPDPSAVSNLFVRGNMAAHYLAFAALAILVVGILRDQGVGVASSPQTMEAQLEERPPAKEEARPERLISGFTLAVAVLAAASFSLRLAAGRNAVPDPVADHISDQMIAGTGYALPGPSGRAAPSALRMPAVPTLLWAARTTLSPAKAARGLWALLGAATVILTGLVARRYFGRTAGIVAALMVALLPSFWMQNVRLHSSTVSAFGVAVLLLFISEPVHRGVGFGRAASAGAAAGLIGLSRPEGILLGLLLLIGWLSAEESTDPVELSHRRAVAAVTLASLALVYAPWVARNQSQFDTWWPTTDIGLVAVGANGPSTYSYSSKLVGSYDPAAARRASERIAQPDAGEGRTDRLLRGQGWRFAQAHPARFVGVAIARVLRSFELWSPTNERAAHEARGLDVRGWLLAWGTFLALLAAAGAGYWLLRSRRRGPLAPLFLAPLAIVATALVSFGDPLMRASIDPVLAIVAAAGISGLAAWLKS